MGAGGVSSPGAPRKLQPFAGEAADGVLHMRRSGARRNILSRRRGRRGAEVRRAPFTPSVSVTILSDSECGDLLSKRPPWQRAACHGGRFCLRLDRLN